MSRVDSVRIAIEKATGESSSTSLEGVVLASDASHYYENMDDGRPFPIVFNVPDMLEGHRRLFREADSPDHVVPGHDPQVLKRYPLVPGDELGIACLHLPPRQD